VQAGSGVLTLGLSDSPGVPATTAAATLTAQYNDIESVKALFEANKGEIAGLILEPVVGNSGFIPPTKEFLQGLRDICTKVCLWGWQGQGPATSLAVRRLWQLGGQVVRAPVSATCRGPLALTAATVPSRCQQEGAVLCFDEVMTGFRIAKGCAQEYFGITPDVTTMGKVIGGGLPVGAYGGKKELMQMVAPAGPMYQVQSKCHGQIMLC
jgi:glutamate-1-semialdehyde 2,1-aminomutase